MFGTQRNRYNPTELKCDSGGDAASIGYLNQLHVYCC